MREELRENEHTNRLDEFVPTEELLVHIVRQIDLLPRRQISTISESTINALTPILHLSRVLSLSCDYISIRNHRARPRYDETND